MPSTAATRSARAKRRWRLPESPGPFIGAWALVTVGPRETFAAVGVVHALAVLPLIAIPNVAVVKSAPGVLATARLGFALAALDGWFDAGFIFVWQMALFRVLGENFPAYGGAMALAGLVGAVFSLMLGRNVDLGHGGRTVAIAYSVAAAIVLVRAGSLNSAWLAVGANALGAVALPLILPVMGTPIYNRAKASPCPFRFSLAMEAGWDIGCTAACLIAAWLTATGVPLSASVLLALPALAVAALLLRGYYRGIGLPVPAQTMSR